MPHPSRTFATAVCATCHETFRFYTCPSQIKRNCGRYCSSACHRNRPLVPLIDRFSRYVGEATSNGCIPWIGPQTAGRGVLGKGRAGQGNIFAHRVAYELAYGPIPKGLAVCHRCDWPLCVNPSHLFLGTQLDNLADMNAKGRHAVGKGTGVAVLDDEQVVLIKLALAAGEKQKDIAARFPVTTSNISAIARGITWKHINLQ